MGDTRIEWATKTWNPTVGCSRVDPACDNCYAMHFAHRRLHRAYEGLTVIRSRPRDTRPGFPRERAELVDWAGVAHAMPERLSTPFNWKGEWVFVDSMSDLFHESIPFEFIAMVYGSMIMNDKNVYVVLTKRIARALEFYEWAMKQWPKPGPEHTALQRALFYISSGWPGSKVEPELWPPRNIIIGFSAGTQATFDRDIGTLAKIPAACRAVSIEPMLEPIRLPVWEYSPIRWVIVGGEAGQGARSCNVEGVVDVAKHCLVHRIPVFVKQLGSKPVDGGRRLGIRIELRDRKGGDWNEWPEWVPRVRQTPEMLTVAGVKIAELGWHCAD